MAGHHYTTASRTKILDYLKDNRDRTVSVTDIQTFLTEHEHSVNVTTIYRFLDRLNEDGEVMKYAAKEGRETVYQYVSSGHHCEEHLHLQCEKCGSIIHLECGFMKEIEKHVKNDHGFEISCKNSVIYGLCEKCR